MKYPIKEAFEAQKNAYAPYSNFKVGAALLCSDGRVYKGCNIENSSYPVTICAERTAVASAIADGNREFKAIVITGGDDYCYPCGMCRQTLAEFADEEFRIVLAKSENETKVYKLGELLPESFVLEK
ncbi:MAG: cytidine deaminase [Clostridia bacterium]|nr:cytidine deaminase [Clostridia bacterium]